ncbi:T9SS type A sorting domain-containing protein [Hymenobacter gummosus]|uniref:T9SS type A sorting domain-containing protein n=1 Tax=Hymenobacter gummosus TaxID=1776032 RepID=A0A431U0P5_9BACT|nr:T9SS type A sorting domain-containing protein [Hymenobacter gummosus]RTQ48495.1 T9SS type A sorting domain-containing protein [Hymenobacter gummosus]
MKHAYLWLFCWLVAASAALAQRPLVTTAAAPGGGGPPISIPMPATNPYTRLVDSLLQHVSKSGVSSSLLYDRVLPLALLHAFEPAVDTSSAQHFRQAYLELYAASYTVPPRPAPERFDDRLDYLARRDSVPLAVLDARFQLLDTLAMPDQLLALQNGLFYDVAGRPRAPFYTRQLTLAAALADTVAAAAHFYVAPELLLSTRGRRVSGLLVDFDNGQGAVACQPGQRVAVSYAAPGRKLLRFTVYFAGGGQAQAQARLVVRASGGAARAAAPGGPVVGPGPGEPAAVSLPLTDQIGTVRAAIPFESYANNGSYYNVGRIYGEGEYLTVLHHPASQAEYGANPQNYQLRNPVIFIDGIDFGDKRKLYFPRPGDEESLYDQLQRNGVLATLDRLQRDLIILNFPKSRRDVEGGGRTSEDIDGGADYIERNAMVLVQLLNTLKPRLAVDPATGQPYKFAIIGPSMGGLVSRYALAFMEKYYNDPNGSINGQPTYLNPDYDHRTSVWLSFDAPHQGANVPLAAQYFLSFYRMMSASANRNLNVKINSPAAQQMLVDHHLKTVQSAAGSPAFRNPFMYALRDNGLPGSLGYPQNLRRVAIANGAQNGQLATHGTPCGEALRMDIWLRNPRLLFLVPRNSLLKLSNARMNFTPHLNNNCTVFEGYIDLVVAFHNFTPFHRREVARSQANGSYDLAPGGWYDAMKQVRDIGEEADDKAGYDMQFFNLHPRHTFIPTVSALGYQYRSMSSYQSTGTLPNPYANLRGYNLVCNDETPFDAYYASATSNTEHVTVNDSDMQAFLFRELAGITETPVFSTAPTSLCPGQSATYTLDQCVNPTRTGQPGTIYTWTLTGPLSFSAGNPADQTRTGVGPSVVIYGLTTPGTGQIEVRATRTGYQASAPLTLPVTVGPSELNLTVNGDCAGSTVTLSANGLNVQGDYRWNINNAGFLPHYNGLAQVQYTLPDNDPTQTQMPVVIEATGTCPGSPTPVRLTTAVLVTYAPGCANQRPAYAVYPNPAQEELTIEESQRAAFQATLYDGQGQPRRQQQAPQGRLRLDTRALPAGLYHLQLRRGNRTEQRQIQVTH